MTGSKPIWTPPEWRGKQENLGTWWTMKKGARVVECTWWSHPLGVEMRCDVDGEMFATKVGRNIHELLDIRDEWQKAFQEKGWL